MKGRLLKFKLDNESINNDLDNFIFSVVMNRPDKTIEITKGKLEENCLEENDYIFIQANNIISHYMLCNKKGPNNLKISIKNPIKLKNPIIKTNHIIFNNTKGPAYSYLSNEHINYIFNLQENDILEKELIEVHKKMKLLKTKIFLKNLIDKYNFDKGDQKEIIEIINKVYLQ
jgi:hypothetical protein